MIWVGTSGWQYRDWRGRFYPGELPQERWLAWYAASFPTVEVNTRSTVCPSDRPSNDGGNRRLPAR